MATNRIDRIAHLETETGSITIWPDGSALLWDGTSFEPGVVEPDGTITTDDGPYSLEGRPID